MSTKDIHETVCLWCPGKDSCETQGQHVTRIIRSNKETGVPMALWPPTGDLFGKTAGSQETLEEAVN